MNFPLFSPLPVHFLFEALAYAIAFRFYGYLRKHTHDDYGSEARMIVLVGAIMGAAIGSKLVGILEHPQIWKSLLASPIYIIGAKSIVGGLVGGTIGVELAKAISRITRSSGDIYVFPLITGIAIGRIGCFAQGVSDGTWGSQTDFIFAMDGGDGVMRHPTPLYEIIALALMALALWSIRKSTQRIEGDMFKLFLVSYCLWRFFVEFLKPVASYGIFSLSIIQFVCLATILYYCAIFALRLRNKIASS
ncbi:MAG: prolipoprotein diacylglyceryl transferase family protein [Pseudomonadota bacterium]